MELDNVKSKLFLEITGTKINRDGYNEYYKSKYAKLSTIIETTKPILNKYNSYIVHRIDLEKKALVTLVFQGNDCVAETYFPINLEQDSQKVGSAITYAKRYNISCLFNLNDSDDDDGNASNNKTTPNNSQQQKPATPQNTPYKLDPNEILKFGKYKGRSIMDATHDPDFVSYCEYMFNSEDQKPDSKYKKSNLEKWAAMLDFARMNGTNDNIPF